MLWKLGNATPNHLICDCNDVKKYIIDKTNKTSTGKIQQLLVKKEKRLNNLNFGQKKSRYVM